MTINEKTIIRTNKKEIPYVMVDKYGLNDDRLSFKAKGILVYLLSKPDNWKISVADLVKRSKDGEDSIRAGLKELLDHGYLSFKQGRNTKGKFGSTEYIIHERPYETDDLPHGEKPDTDSSPYGDFPDAGFPDAGNPALIIKDLNNKELNKKEEEEEKKVMSESESIFSELIKANNISKDTATDIKKLLKKMDHQLEQFSAWSIRTTFAKLSDNAATIHHIPSWFITAIKGQQDKYNLTYAK